MPCLPPFYQGALDVVDMRHCPWNSKEHGEYLTNQELQLFTAYVVLHVQNS